MLESETGMWVLTRYADVLAALRHPGASIATGLLANPRSTTSATLQTMAKTMLFCDDRDAHARERRLVRQAFTRRTVEGLRPYMAGLVASLLDPCVERGEFDVMGDFVDHLPVAVICEMLGVPHEDIPTFIEWNFQITAVTGVVVTDDEFAKIDAATVNVNAYLGALLDERAKAPRDDLLSALIQARDGEDLLSKEETLGMAFLLLVAGSDTTAAFLGGAIAALLRNPEQLALLRRTPDLMPDAIEELMRFEAPVHFGIMRTMTEPLTLESVEIPAGAPIWPILSAANRDPGRFDDPHRLDLRRENVRHVGFGQGMHMCLGAMLARLESNIALTGLLDRFPSLELVEDPIPWVNHGNLRGIKRLTVSAGAG